MTKREQYWSDHLAAIRSEAISVKAYARREGLSAGALYYWRKRFKQTTKSSRQLVPVRLATAHATGGNTACTLTLGPSVHLELPQLPDPDWLARVVSATTNSVR